MNMSSVAFAAHKPLRAAVIGAGAAGLVTARHLRDAGLDVVIFEQSSNVGGLWNYSDSNDGVMYKSLRTNLPKEIMQLQSQPFPSAWPSFLPHTKVAEYLNTYARTHHLLENIRFCTRVDQITPKTSDDASTTQDVRSWPNFLSPCEQAILSHEQESLKDNSMYSESTGWTIQSTQLVEMEGTSTVENNKPHTGFNEQFDVVAVCNGHYSIPSIPQLSNSDKFPGKQIHSKFYRSSIPFRGSTVLVVGMGPSGTDIAIELANHDCTVVTSTRNCENSTEKMSIDRINQTNSPSPSQQSMLSVGEIIGVHPESGHLITKHGNLLPNIDTILWCTGYEYTFPFLSTTKNNDNTKNSSPLVLQVSERRVHPLYKQLFHAMYPSLAFVGIPWKVSPFPMFDYQADALATVWSGKSSLPCVNERINSMYDTYDEITMRQSLPLRYTHMLGSRQWSYCRDLYTSIGNGSLLQINNIDNDLTTCKLPVLTLDDTLVDLEAEITPALNVMEISVNSLPTNVVKEAENEQILQRMDYTETPIFVPDTSEKNALDLADLLGPRKLVLDQDIYLDVSQTRQKNPHGYRSRQYSFQLPTSSRTESLMVKSTKANENDTNKNEFVHDTNLSASDKHVAKVLCQVHPGWCVSQVIDSNTEPKTEMTNIDAI